MKFTYTSLINFVAVEGTKAVKKVVTIEFDKYQFLFITFFRRLKAAGDKKLYSEPSHGSLKKLLSHEFSWHDV
jgi:hypothetical protein